MNYGIQSIRFKSQLGTKLWLHKLGTRRSEEKNTFSYIKLYIQDVRNVFCNPV